jgi:DNA polymerase III subunit delta
MDIKNIIKDIKNKTLLPIYFLHGEEPYYIDQLCNALEKHVLEEDQKAFNEHIFYGKDISMDQLIGYAQQYPMGGDRQLIIVKEAQELKLGTNEKARDLLNQYCSSPMPSTVLVFAHKHKKLDGKLSLTKNIKKNNWLFEFEKIKDYRMAPWIQEHLKAEHLAFESYVPQLLADYLGNDLSRIHNEIIKLKIYLKSEQKIDAQLIEQHIGISREFNVFELHKVLQSRQASKSMQMAFHLGKSEKDNPIQMMMGSLYNLFSNAIMYFACQGLPQAEIAADMGVAPYALKNFDEINRHYKPKELCKIISVLREIDLKSKGLGANNLSSQALLQELVYKIIHIDKIKIQ